MPMKVPAAREPLLTDRQVAERLGIGVTTARRLRYAGQLPTVRVGTLARVPAEAVEEFVKSNTK